MAEDDEYETEEQAIVRIRNAAGQALVNIPEDLNETITEYAAFNQAEFFEPLFESGEIHSALRTLIDEPLHVSTSLRGAVRFADMRNEERALTDKMGTYGPVVVRTRTIVRSPWTEVTYDEIDRVRNR
jgi:hypothetical protein